MTSILRIVHPRRALRLYASPTKIILPLILLPLLTPLAGCYSYQIAVTVENRTGAPVQLLEVDYPTASFGADAIAPGADFHYRIELRGSGALKVQYTAPDERQIQVAGPALHERQQGQLQIILLPGGRAQFLPQLTP